MGGLYGISLLVIKNRMTNEPRWSLRV